MRRELSCIVKISILKLGILDNPLKVSAAVTPVFEEEGKRSSAGIRYEQSLQLIISRADSAPLLKFTPGFDAVVQLSDTLEEYVWGNSFVPVKVIINPQFERVELDMTCYSLFPLVRA